MSLRDRLSFARAPDVNRVFLIGMMLTCGTVTLPMGFNVGGITGLAVVSIIGCVGAWSLWILDPDFPGPQIRPLLPLVMFSLYASGSLLWCEAAVKAFQLVCATVGFLGFIVLTAREGRRDPTLPARLHRALDVGALFSAATYAVLVAFYGEGADGFVGEWPVMAARAFALYAMVTTARQLARWRAGERRGLVYALLVIGVVFLSQSRMALVACLALFPLSVALKGDRRSITGAVLTAAAGFGLLIAAILFYPPMYERFFGFDASLQVGGVSINASGRTDMWVALVNDLFSGGLWMFGKGAASSSLFIDSVFPELGHPHNDYLRYLYDFGLFGLACWVAFLAAIFTHLTGAAVRAARRSSPDLPLHLAPLLALAAVCMAMYTDNAVSYMFVMAPLGMLIGCSLSRLGPDPTRAQALYAVRVRLASELVVRRGAFRVPRLAGPALPVAPANLHGDAAGSP